MTERNRKSTARKVSGSGKLRRRILLVITGLILGLNFYRWNASALAGNALPMPFGTGMAVVLSGSMEPTLEVNDVIIVREADRYDAGDIVVYQSGRTLIVHRIIVKDGETIITQGDANHAADAPIEMRAIKGKVIARIPWLGAVVNVLKTPAGILIVLVVAFVLTEFSFRKEKDKDEKELEAIKAEIRRLREKQEEKE